MDGSIMVGAEAPDRTAEVLRDIAQHPVVKRGRAREFKAMVAITFVFFLFGLAIARLVPLHRRVGKKVQRQPLLREAWSKANASIGFAFQCL